MIESRIYLYILFGIAIVAAVAVQRHLRNTLIPFPLLYVGIGWAIFSLPIGLPTIDYIGNEIHAVAGEYLTEFLVIASLSAAGKAIDRPFSVRCWNQVWPLLLITMPLSIALVALFGWYVMGLTAASAIFLGAVLSPTDPVLASSVKVGPPGETSRHDIRFSLTVEAGANDGLAFPFVHLAIAAIGMTALGDWTWHWALEDALWRVGAGLVAGYGFGKFGAWYLFSYLARQRDETSEQNHPLSYSSEGVVTLGALLCSYGLAEAVHGYGFLAVFVAAVTTKQAQPDHGFHAKAHSFEEQIERVLLVIILLFLGAFVAQGALLALTWQGALLGVLVVFLIRPLSGMIGQSGCDFPLFGKITIAFLGVRGIGSLYYLLYGQNHGEFGDVSSIWAAVTFTILLSILVHGVAAPLFLRKAEEKAAHTFEAAKEHSNHG